MPTFIARNTISPRFREAHFKALKGNGKLPEDMAANADAHLEYQRDLKAKGKILYGGPMVDFTWGILAIRADTIEEATEIARGDPGFKTGLLLDCEVIPWYHMV
jgi:uncharacterized protein YciI